MKIAALVYLIIIAIFLACSLQAGNSPSSPHLWNQELFLRIYLDSLGMISYEITIDYKLNTLKDQQKILKDIARNHQIVKRLNLKNIIPPTSLLERYERYLVPRVFDYVKRRELRPTKAEKMRYYQEHIKDYIEPAYFEGARFLIETSPMMEKTALYWKKILDEQNRPFREIAREYYRSIGEDKDGYLPKVYRGTIRDELFEIFFNADVNAPYFGPVNTKYGLLFGKVYSKREEAPRPFEEVEPRIESLMIKQRIEKFYQEFFASQRSKHTIEILFDDSLANEAPSFDTPVYRFDGRVVTYREILAVNQHIFGDTRAIDFFRAIRTKAINNELICTSSEAEKIKHSPEYQFLYDAFIDQYRVYQYLTAEYKKIKVGEKDLIEFYERHKQTLYKKPLEAKLLIVSVPMNPDRLSHPYSIHLARKKAWESINRIRDDFVESGKGEKFSFEPYYKEVRGLKSKLITHWQAIDTLGRVIEMDIPSRKPGYISPVLIGNTSYIFYYLLDLRDPGYKAFKEIRKKVENDFIEAKKREIRRKLGIE